MDTFSAQLLIYRFVDLYIAGILMEIQADVPLAHQPEFQWAINGPGVLGPLGPPVGSRGNTLVGILGAELPPTPAEINFKVSRALYLSSPESIYWSTYLSSNSIGKLLSNTKQFNIKTYFTWQESARAIPSSKMAKTKIKNHMHIFII